MGKNELTEDMQNTNNEVGISDDLGQDIESQYKEELLTEIKNFEDTIEKTQQDLDNFKEQWENDLVIYDEMLKEGAIRRINPEFNYELSDRYWNAREKQLGYKFRMDKHMAEAKMQQYQTIIDTSKEQLEQAQQKLKELEE